MTGPTALTDLSLSGKFKEKNFVHTADDGTQTVDSTKLEKFIARWADHLKEAKSSKQQECLKRINPILECLCALSQTLFLSYLKNESPLSLEVILSFKILGSTIDDALSDKELNHYPRQWGLTPIAISRMKENGWCPRDIAVTAQFLTDTSMYCASYIQRNSGGKDQDHSKCNEVACEVNQVDEATYKTKHREENCGCEMWSVPIEQLQQIIRDNKVPWIDMKPAKLEDGTKSLHIELGARKDSIVERAGLHFSIFSHVWSDGKSKCSSETNWAESCLLLNTFLCQRP